MIKGFFDGASRGNPGPAGAGAVIYDGERVIWRCAKPLGIKTNNEAEYAALGILADELIRRNVKNPEIRGDSKLIISQVTGAWKIKEARLAALAAPLKEKLKELGASCRWIPREQNSEADRLSNIALDKGSFLEDLENQTEPTAEPVEEKSAQKESDSSEVCMKTEPAQRMRFKRVWGRIWLVADGNEVFAVDLAHGCCSCAEGRKDGRCRHANALLAQIAEAKN